jgi:polyisoprenoid-binding protein YceI
VKIIGVGPAADMKTRTRFSLSVIWVLALGAANFAQTASRQVVLNFVPANATVKFTLGASLHSVHGSFALKSGAVHFDPASGKVSGEIVLDAASGQTGNEGRDKKMHAEVLESGRYPEIVFRPDRVDGQFAAQGVSTLQVHGIFAIRGSEHEMTIPVRIETSSGRWTANSSFAVPYIKWGMKNPSTFILRVEPSVDLEVQASGDLP